MPVPTIVYVASSDNPKPVDFPAWPYDEKNAPPITVVLVETERFGAIRPLLAKWNSVWKFNTVSLGTGGMGVRGELIFDKSAGVPVECIPYYDNVFWPHGAVLNLWCSYPNQMQELLQVQLTL